MRNTFTPILVLGAACGLLLLVLGCPEERDNPLDPGADLPDPFHMQADLTPQGVLVEWQAVKVKGVDGYRVYRSTQAASAAIPVGEVPTTVTSYLDQEGYANTTYWYRIVALDSEGKESEACQPDSVTVTGARLSTSPSSWSAGAAKDSLWLHISSDSTICRFNYTIASDSGWLTVSKTSGTAPDSVWTKVGTSSSSTSRTGRVIVTALGVAGTPDTIAVTQYPSDAEPMLVISPDSVRLPGLGGTSDQIQITIVNGTSPTFSVASSESSWLTVSKSGGTTPDFFTVTAQDNFTATSRHGVVIALANGCAPETLKVYQPRMVWEPLGEGLDNRVMATCVYKGELYAGGYFTGPVNEWGVGSLNKIARWDGTHWAPLVQGVRQSDAGAQVHALYVYGGKLIVTGWFNSPGLNVAAWDSTAWSTLGSGLGNQSWSPGAGYAVGEDRYGLIVGGAFGTPASGTNVARWNASSESWSAIGVNLGAVEAIASYNSDLIIGGQIASGIARNIYPGWPTLGSGIDGNVWSLLSIMETGELVAGGDFTMAGGIVANNIAVWDGASWRPLGSGTTERVEALEWYNKQIIVGGRFVISGGVPAYNIARWDGSQWLTLGQGMNGYVYALTVFNGDLVAAGDFTEAGGSPANRIAILKEQD